MSDGKKMATAVFVYRKVSERKEVFDINQRDVNSSFKVERLKFVVFITHLQDHLTLIEMSLFPDPLIRIGMAIRNSSCQESG